MLRRSLLAAATLTAAAGGIALAPPAAADGSPCTTGADGVRVCTGATTAEDGAQAPFRYEVPADWNGTLLLWSRGGPVPTPPMPGPDNLRATLLDQGYALLASTYSHFGWAVEEGPADQMAALDVFETEIGSPERTIAWGGSLGGVITGAIAERFPDRIDGAIPLCHGLGGTVAQWNQLLDATFVVDELIATGDDLDLVHLPPYPGPTPPDAATTAALLQQAQSTPEGRARIALAAAMNNSPLWVDPADPRPDRRDLAAQQAQMHHALQNAVRLGMGVPRQELEYRAGGNFSWNVGVDYREQLQRSGHRQLVEALYREAGLDLRRDLDLLATAPRIAADPDAVAYALENLAPSGELLVPVLTMNTTGDASALAAHSRTYEDAVRRAGDAGMLRTAYVDAPGHCTFTAAEHLAALRAMEHRLDTGRWGQAATPGAMNRVAETSAVPGPARFVRYLPERLLRPCNAGQICSGQP
ncbi:alpha/beta hydrolase family protein [Blastococcus sp. SYSU DS0828]